MSNIGKQIFYLANYNWERGILVKENRKTYTVEWTNYGNYLIPNQKITEKFPKEKCAFADEVVCVVWETWRGVNGRGAYRVERELYPTLRIPAKNISRQTNDNRGSGRINENSYGVTPHTEQFYTEKEQFNAVLQLLFFFSSFHF